MRNMQFVGEKKEPKLCAKIDGNMWIWFWLPDAYASFI
jgi:hypothetical protein